MRTALLASLFAAGCSVMGQAPHAPFPQNNAAALVQQCEETGMEAVRVYIPSTGLDEDISVLAELAETGWNAARVGELRSRHTEVTISHCHPELTYQEFIDNLEEIIIDPKATEEEWIEYKKEFGPSLYDAFRETGFLPSAGDYYSHVEAVCLHSDANERTTEYVVTRRDDSLFIVRYALRSQERVFARNYSSPSYCRGLMKRVLRRAEKVYNRGDLNAEGILEEMRKRLPMFEIDVNEVKL